jgi:hypothetical protein
MDRHVKTLGTMMKEHPLAALAAGLYLCAGGDDVSTRSGAESAVYRLSIGE